MKTIFNKTKIASVVAATAIAGGTGAYFAQNTSTETSPNTINTLVDTTDPNYIEGDCGGSISPEPDPCEAAQGTIRNAFLMNFVNTSGYKAWKRDSPGEVQRLKEYMTAPSCPTPSNLGNIPTMNSRLGMALVNLFQGYACAKGLGPIDLPDPISLDPKRKDKVAPTVPKIGSATSP